MIQNSEPFSAHLSVLKAAIAMLILFIYLHLDLKAGNAPYKIQIIEQDLFSAASELQEKGRKIKEVKLTHKMHLMKPKFGTELDGSTKENMTNFMAPLFRQSTIPGKQNDSSQINSIWFSRILCDL